MYLLWLVPVVYAMHIAEEAPRFVPWTRLYPKLFSHSFRMHYFIIGNSVWMLYTIGCAVLAQFSVEPWALAVSLSAAAWIFANSWIHILTTLSSGVYSPGLVTASALYLPVSALIYWTYFQQGMLNLWILVFSLVIGFGIMYLPMLAAPRLDRIEAARAERANRISGGS